VLSEAASPHKICGHEGQRAGVRGAGDARPRERVDTLGVGAGCAAGIVAGGRSGGGGPCVAGELLALRTILINLLFSVSKGEPVTPEQMQALIERADRDKMRRALESWASPG